jgi:hypothetical protein
MKAKRWTWGDVAVNTPKAVSKPAAKPARVPEQPRVAPEPASSIPITVPARALASARLVFSCTCGEESDHDPSNGEAGSLVTCPGCRQAWMLGLDGAWAPIMKAGK